MRPARLPHRPAGFSLVEVLVGLVIGIVSLLLIYQVFAVAEGYKRTATSGGDAQTTGVVSTFLVAQELTNGGSAIASSPELALCNSTGNFATTWRPLPVLIRDGGGPANSDGLDVFYGVSPVLVTAVLLRNTAAPGVAYEVQSPMGFRQNDLFVVVDPAAFSCEAATVTNVPVPDANGVVNIAHTPVVNTYAPGSFLVNLGPDPNSGPPAPVSPTRKVRYDTCPSPFGGCVASQAGTLRSLDLLQAGAVPNPIASNVALMKAQYGLDTDGDTFIDTWQAATGAWDYDTLLNLPPAQFRLQVRQIKAVRIALVVRSAQFERSRDAEGHQWAPYLDVDFTTTLFPCNGLPGCTGEIAAVTLPGSANYRYRVFEQVIPLRSQIWNP